MKVLLTTQFLRNFTGSEVVMYDVARELLATGHDVTLAAFEIKNPLLEILRKTSANVVNLKQVEGKFDLIWSQHFPTIEFLMEKRIAAKKIIFSSLSPYESLESPPICFDRVTLFLANSDETKQTLVEMGLEENMIEVFPNPASREFFSHEAKPAGHLKKIAVVSNTVQPAMEEMAAILGGEGVSVEFIGIKRHHALVTPGVLDEFDAVVTIGKTVQYCLALGKPVFVYDRFGGCGYLTKDNMDRARWYNFSGRCTRELLPAQELANRIKAGFPLVDRNFYRACARDHFQIDKHVGAVLRKLLKTPAEKREFLLQNIEKRRNIFLSK